MSENKLKATNLLYKAGYSPEDAAKVADAILTPADGVMNLDYKFFMSAPKEIGKTLAEILPMSEAKSLKIDEHNPVYGFTKTPLGVMRSNCGKNFGKINALGDLLEALPKSKIENVSLNELALGDEIYTQFAKGIAESSQLKSVSINHCDVEPSIVNGSFLPDLAKSNVENFGLIDCGIRGNYTSSLMEHLAKSKVLKSVDFSCNGGLFRDSSGDFISALPSSVEKLNVSNCDITDWHTATQVAAHIRQNKNLTDLGLSACKMEENVARDIINVLGDTNLWRVDLSGNQLDDRAAQELTESISREDCRIYETRLMEKPAVPAKDILRQEMQNTAEESSLAELKKAEDRNAVKYQVFLDQEKAKVDYEKQSKEERKSDLFTAAKAGKIGEVLTMVPLRPKDLLKADEKGKTLLQHVWESGSLNQVFSPKNWSNAKEMQQIWNEVPKKYQKQMDGKDGHDSFIKNKSIVTANALRKSLSKGR